MKAEGEKSLMKWECGTMEGAGARGARARLLCQIGIICCTAAFLKLRFGKGLNMKIGIFFLDTKYLAYGDLALHRVQQELGDRRRRISEEMVMRRAPCAWRTFHPSSDIHCRRHFATASLPARPRE